MNGRPAGSPSSVAGPGQETVPRLKAEGVVMRPHGDDLVVYEYLVGGFYVLNRSARLVLDQVDGRRTVAEVAERSAELSQGSIDRADAVELLGQLAALGVIDTSAGPSQEALP